MKSSARSAAERVAWLESDVQRKNVAIDAALGALVQLSKTGSLRRDVREEVIQELQEARNERLF